jgi:hypothetical protein
MGPTTTKGAAPKAAKAPARSDHVIDLRAQKAQKAGATSRPASGRSYMDAAAPSPANPKTPAGPRRVVGTVPTKPAAAATATQVADVDVLSLPVKRRFWSAFWRFLLLMIVLGAIIGAAIYAYITYYQV